MLYISREHLSIFAYKHVYEQVIFILGSYPCVISRCLQRDGSMFASSYLHISLGCRPQIFYLLVRLHTSTDLKISQELFLLVMSIFILISN